MARRKRTHLKAPEICPVCGEEVPSDSLACPECGADHNSGWRLDDGSDEALDLPDAEFDYDRFVKEEFGTSFKPAGIKVIWWITALLVFLALILAYCYAG
jgi:zinc-ribbon domain